MISNNYSTFTSHDQYGSYQIGNMPQPKQQHEFDSLDDKMLLARFVDTYLNVYSPAFDLDNQEKYDFTNHETSNKHDQISFQIGGPVSDYNTYPNLLYDNSQDLESICYNDLISFNNLNTQSNDDTTDKDLISFKETDSPKTNSKDKTSDEFLEEFFHSLENDSLSPSSSKYSAPRFNNKTLLDNTLPDNNLLAQILTPNIITKTDCLPDTNNQNKTYTILQNKIDFKNQNNKEENNVMANNDMVERLNSSTNSLSVENKNHISKISDRESCPSPIKKIKYKSASYNEISPTEYNSSKYPKQSSEMITVSLVSNLINLFSPPYQTLENDFDLHKTINDLDPEPGVDSTSKSLTPLQLKKIGKTVKEKQIFFEVLEFWFPILPENEDFDFIVTGWFKLCEEMKKTNPVTLTFTNFVKRLDNELWFFAIHNKLTDFLNDLSPNSIEINLGTSTIVYHCNNKIYTKAY